MLILDKISKNNKKSQLNIEPRKMIDEKEIKEINQHIRDGVNQWADVMLMADADQWAVHLNYFPRDIVNATMIFQHICSNIGIKTGRIDEDKAEEFGKRLRQLVIDMTGYDPATIVSVMKSTVHKRPATMAERFIKDYTRNCSNEMVGGGYHEWLTPEQALRAVLLAIDEVTQ